MAILIKGKGIERIDKSGKPGNIRFGIDHSRVENPKIVMGHNLIQPSFRGRRHYHANCNVGQYMISGHRRYLIGPDFAMQEIDIEPGDFIFIPQGEIHGTINLSDTETSELVFCYTGVNSKEEAGTIYIDPPKAGKK
jgi:uncharacterized RmlC-like cupin family protein